MISKEEYGKPHKCPVCGEFEFPQHGSFDFCEVCGWQDDAVQEEDEHFGGANPEGLYWARILYKNGRSDLPINEKFKWLRDNGYDKDHKIHPNWFKD